MSRMLTVFPVLALNIFAIGAIAEPTNVINTTFGLVQGEILTTVGNGVRYSSFKGIPYAKPPIGDLRLQPPQYLKKWTGVFNATTAGPACPQMSQGLTEDYSYIGDEDCLYINVFSPVTNLGETLTELKAILIWIHGGSFMSGSSDPDFYGPDFLIENDVVVFTFNYRLGPLGFLSINEPGANGNLGLRDQSFALIWSLFNSNQFGGDNLRITLIGQGAGGASVLYQSMADSFGLSRGYINGVIAMSGSPMNPWAFQTSEDALNNGYELAANLGVKATSTGDILKIVASEDAKNIVMAAFNMYPKMFLPTRENKNTSPDMYPFLESCIVEKFRTGNFSQVPYILGYTSNETLAFFQNENSISALLTEAQTFASSSNTQSAIPSVYNVNKGNDDWTRQVIEETSDLLFQAGIQFTKDQITSKSPQPVYYYRVSYTDDQHALHYFHGINETGVANGDDLVYLWWIKDADMPLDPTSKISIIRSTMIRLFTNLAKYGNPTPAGMDDPVLKEQWPNYGYRWPLLQLEFGSEIQVGPKMNINAAKIIAESEHSLRSLRNCTK